MQSEDENQKGDIAPKRKTRLLSDHEINDFNKTHILVHSVEPGHEYNIIVENGPNELTKSFVTKLTFQHGPVADGANGITDEALLAIVLDRLRGFQGTAFRCRENSLVITKLEEALHWLQHRAQERERRGVEGTHEV